MSNQTDEFEQRDPNNVLIEHRNSRGWGRGRLAAEFERIGRDRGFSLPSRSALEKAIYRHESGQSQVTDDVYVQLYCAAFDASSHELFGDIDDFGPTGGTFRLTSNKFIPVFVGPSEAKRLRDSLQGNAHSLDWADCWTADLEHPEGLSTVYGFDWGVVVYCLEEEVHEQMLARVAIWRRNSYKRELTWTAEHLSKKLADCAPVPEYVLSTFWMHTPKWEGRQLETALRLLCTPRALLDHGTDGPNAEHAALIENSFIRDGYTDPRIVDFGVRGVSMGYASWAGVSYFPLAARRALPQPVLRDFEVITQALWCYCHYIRTQVEMGMDPTVPSEYGWRWLRGMRSRLSGARPRETAQLAAMRMAILDTSELRTHITDAIEMVRDIEREGSYGPA